MKLLTKYALFLTVAASMFGAQVPRQAPEFDFVDANGKHTLMSSYKGKVVLIQFLLTTCPHCQAMSQMLTKMEGELGPKGFQAVGVAYNDATPDMVRAYSAQYAKGFPIAYAPPQTIRNFIEASVMDRLMFPHVVVVDKKGVVRAESKIEGSPELQEETSLRTLINSLLAEGAGSTSSSKAAPKKAPAVASATK